MKKTILSLLVATTLLFTGTAEEPVQAATNPNANSHVIYYIPHQDDEALTFGVSIMNHLKGGHNVHVVLMTDGAGSGVRTKLGMTAEEFQEARNKEFAYALNIMGVKPENIEYRNLPDGTVTTAQYKAVAASYEKQYPKAKHKVFSATDPHSDHANGGKAFREMQKAGTVSDVRYYVKQQDNPKNVRLFKESFYEEYRPLMRAVKTAYSIQNPAIGFYGIGNISVRSSFQSFEQQPVSRYHK